MSQDIKFELDEDTDTFHLFLDGEDQGPVDTESLRDSAGSLYLHFTMFKDREPEDTNEDIEEYAETLTDDEVEEELIELEEDLEDIED
jgi:hypothetical protein